jgi:hypothetical protein
MPRHTTTAPALLQEVAPWDGPSQHNWRDAHIASRPSRLLLGFTGEELVPEAAAGEDEQLGATSNSGRQLKSALAAAKLSWGRGSLRLSPIAPTAAAHVLRRAAAFLDGGELGPAGGSEQAEIMLPVPVALPDGFTLESGTLQPNESGSGFAELFAKVPHKGSGVAAGAHRVGPDDADARQQEVQKGDAVLESGKLDAAGSGAGDQKQPVPPAANKDSSSSSSSSADDDGSLSAIPSAAVIEAQRLKQAAAEKQAKEASASPPASTASPPNDGGGGADAVSLIPTDPTAPRMVPYVGSSSSSSSSSSIPYSAGGVIISGGLPHGDASGARSASLASLRDRASRMESGEQQSSAAHQAMPPAALAGIVVGVVGGVGAGVALLLVLRARNARKAAAVAAAVATGRKARAPAAAPVASRESDGDSEEEEDVEAAGAVADAPAATARSR